MYTWVPGWLQERIRARATEYGPSIFGEHTTKDPNVITDVWRRKLIKLWSFCGPWKEKPTPHRSGGSRSPDERRCRAARDRAGHTRRGRSRARGPVFGSPFGRIPQPMARDQGGFVDEPRCSVEKANQFVETVIERLTVLFASERAKLENQWREGKDASTEDLRQALPVPLVFRPALVDLTKAIAGG